MQTVNYLWIIHNDIKKTSSLFYQLFFCDNDDCQQNKFTSVQKSNQILQHLVEALWDQIIQWYGGNKQIGKRQKHFWTQVKRNFPLKLYMKVTSNPALCFTK